MCTVVLLRRPGHPWPLILGANRDEMVERSWRPPARHWPDRPDVVAGIDEQAGGTWLGINDTGVVAGILNRRHSLGPAPDRRSRGELVLEALDHADAVEAATALADVDPRAYRAFNMVVADNRDAFWIKSLGDSGPDRVAVHPVPDGIAMFTAWDMNDPDASARTRSYLPRFEAAPAPDPDADEWEAWEALLASTQLGDHEDDPNGAMHVVTGWGFATVSSSLIALPAVPRPQRHAIWRFASTWPRRQPFSQVSFAPAAA